MDTLDTLLDITACTHTILLCTDSNSGCTSPNECTTKAHIDCCCPMGVKIPQMELKWLHSQRCKFTEKSDMMMLGIDVMETNRQNKAAKRSAAAAEAQSRKKKKIRDEESCHIDQQDLDNTTYVLSEDVERDIRILSDDINCDTFIPGARDVMMEKENLNKLVDCLLKQKLGELSYLVVQYLDRPRPKRNMMPVINTAKASIRRGMSPADAATVASEFLKDLIAAGFLQPEMSYLACDPSKMERARKQVMAQAREVDQLLYSKQKIVGLSYDGRKDKNTRTMVSDSFGKERMRMIKEEHISVSDEPKGRYIGHFVPDKPTLKEKPALKVAQSLHDLLDKHDSIDSLLYLGGDSTNTNTGNYFVQHTSTSTY